jgi:hypothetical protein
VKIPDEYEELFGAASTLVSVSKSLPYTDNTIPFAIYQCEPIAIPPIPVTPVLWNLAEAPTEPWFPDPEVPD